MERSVMNDPTGRRGPGNMPVPRGGRQALLAPLENRGFPSSVRVTSNFHKVGKRHVRGRLAVHLCSYFFKFRHKLRVTYLTKARESDTILFNFFDKHLEWSRLVDGRSKPIVLVEGAVENRVALILGISSQTNYFIRIVIWFSIRIVFIVYIEAVLRNIHGVRISL